jgi:hypothetical protein
MSLNTQAILDILAIEELPFADYCTAVSVTGSNLTGAIPRVPAQVARYTAVPNSPATAAVVLPSLLTGEVCYPMFVVNEHPTNSLIVYAYADNSHVEKINGTASTFGGATGGFSVAANSVGVFFPIGATKGRQGSSSPNQLTWSAASFT